MTVRRTFPVQSRQSTVQAPLESQSYLVPSGLVNLIFQLDIPTADYENTANAVDITIEEQIGAEWVATPSAMSWRGGQFQGKLGLNPPPRKIFMGATLAGKTVRMSVVIPVAMQLGGTISTEP